MSRVRVVLAMIAAMLGTAIATSAQTAIASGDKVTLEVSARARTRL